MLPNPQIQCAKLKGFDGSEDFNDFLAHFEIFVTLHGWDYRTKSLFLASSLAGSAQALLTELNETQRMDYKSLVDRRFGSVERAELFRAQLKTRVKGTNETISELAQSVMKLTRQAYPTTDQSVLNILALEQFIDDLSDPDIRLRLQETRATDIKEAKIIVIRLETHRIADARRSASTLSMSQIQSNEFESIREELFDIIIVMSNRNPKPTYPPIGPPQNQNQTTGSNFRYQRHQPQRVMSPEQNSFWGRSNSSPDNFD